MTAPPGAENGEIPDLGTRCIIAAENHDGSISAAICFLDGNPDEAGRKLLANYTDPADIHALISLRSIYNMGRSPHHPLDYYAFTRPENVDNLIRQLDEHCIVLAHNIDAAGDFQHRSLRNLANHLPDTDMRYAYVYGEGGWSLLEPPDWRPQSLQLYMDAQTTAPPP